MQLMSSRSEPTLELVRRFGPTTTMPPASATFRCHVCFSVGGADPEDVPVVAVGVAEASFRPPVQQTRVELARPHLIGRVELEVNDRHWGRRHALCPSAAVSGAARRAASAIAATAPASESAAAAVIAIVYPSLRSPVVA